MSFIVIWVLDLCTIPPSFSCAEWPNIYLTHRGQKVVPVPTRVRGFGQWKCLVGDGRGGLGVLWTPTTTVRSRGGGRVLWMTLIKFMVSSPFPFSFSYFFPSLCVSALNLDIHLSQPSVWPLLYKGSLDSFVVGRREMVSCTVLDLEGPEFLQTYDYFVNSL